MNGTIGRQNGLHISVIGWDSDARPELGGDGQDVINRQIANMSDHDLFVGIMWNRFGSPTPRAGSGTEEEFQRALESLESTGSPQIMLYFGQMAAPLDTEQAIEQKAKVIAFRKQVEAKGLVWRYGSPEEFRILFARHLSGWLLALPTAGPPTPPKTTGKLAKADSGQEVIETSGNWVLLGDRFLKAANVVESDGFVKLDIVCETTRDDEFLRTISARSTKLQFAYQNQAGAAEMIRGQRESDATGDRWNVELRVQSDVGFYQEMSFNNYSSQDMAEMRARLILLGDAIPKDTFLAAFLIGHDSAILGDGLFKSLWKQLKGNRNEFLPLARLLAVYYLKSTGTVAQITQLQLGPITDGRLEVKFEGIRPRYYTNVYPKSISLKGQCSLD